MVVAQPSISISGTTGNPSDTGTSTQGSSATNANLPPYYSLCYIVKHTATSGSGGGSSTTIISPVAYAVVGTNSAGSGTGMSWGAYDSSTGQVVFTFAAAQPDTDYYVHTNREHFATHNIEVLSKTTTGFTTKWTNSDTSLLPPGTFKGVLIVYASTPTKTVGGGSNSGSSTFTGLTDTPSSLGTAGQVAAVNSGGTALEFIDVPSSATTSEWSITSNGSSDYRFTGPGFDGTENDPTIYLVRGQQYKFTNNSGGSHPFQIRTAIDGTAYNDGITNNGLSKWHTDLGYPDGCSQYSLLSVYFSFGNVCTRF